MEYPIAIAPMVDITHKLYRYLMRLLTKQALLYTEMQIDQLVINDHSVMDFNPCEHPVVAQLGGKDPTNLAAAATICEQLGYDQINLNCGCPSSKIKSGCFGASLMLDPDLVRSLCVTMRETVSIPVTVKCRLGVDSHDSYEEFINFVGKVRESGVSEVIVHARKAFLKGLNPHQNRTVPPLIYDWVYSAKEVYPDLKFWINGGITTHTQIKEHFDKGVDGVMIGRASYNNPFLFRNVDSMYYGKEDPGLNRLEILEAYGEYCDQVQAETKLYNHCFLAKPITNLFHGEHCSGQYRAELDRLSKAKRSWEFKPIVDTLVEFMQGVNPDSLNSL